MPHQGTRLQVVRVVGIMPGFKFIPRRASKVPQCGFTLISALIGIALLTGLILFMTVTAIHFRRLNEEALSGTEMEMVVETLLSQYIWQRQSVAQTVRYHITSQGIIQVVDENSTPEHLIDTVEAVFWSEDLRQGRRFWGHVRSLRSKRAVSAVHYRPKS